MKSNFYKLVAALVVLIWSMAAHAQLITTIAGNGSAGGWLAWGGPATQCQFNNPIGISIGPDPSGSGNDIYIADSVNNIIRMVDPTGTISVFAGGGTTGLGDGLPAVQAGLSGPTGVASDGGSGVYIADCNNNRIRYVSLYTGIISTVVNNTGSPGYSGDGFAALTARITNPYGVRVVGGVLYIADRGNNAIRMVDMLGKIHTVAGFSGLAGYTNDGGPDTAAEFHNPTGLAQDPSGNIYIADQLNHVVRKITPAGFISTFAGNSHKGYAGDAVVGGATTALLDSPTSLAWSTSNTTLYIADAGNHCIRSVNSAGTINTFAGMGGVPGYTDATGTSANFNFPSGICIAGGNMFVADMRNNVIREINIGSAAVTTYAGSLSGTAGYGGDGAALTPSSALFNAPAGLGVDATGSNLYIADAGNYCVRVINLSTNFLIGVFAGMPGTAGNTGDGGVAYPGSKLTYPTGVVLDVSGNVYIADEGDNRVRKVTAGIINAYAGSGGVPYNGDVRLATSLALYSPYGLTVDNNGNVLIADSKDNRIRIVVNNPTPLFAVFNNMYTLAGNGVQGYGGSATYEYLNGPTNVMMSGAGNMFIADRGNNVVRRVDPKGVMSTYAGTGVWSYTGDGVAGGATNATYEYPVSVAFYNGGGTAGLLFVGDANNHVVRMIDPATGTSVLYAGQPGVSGNSGDGGPATATGGLGCELGYIGGIEVDQSNGDLYIVDQSNGVVRKASGTVPSHTMSTVAGTGIPGYLASGGPATSCMLTSPYSIATDTFGNKFVADRDNHVIRKIDKNGIISVYAGTGFAGYLDGVATTGQLCRPDGVALDTLGNLYISDMGNNRIRKVTKSTGLMTTIIGSGVIGTVVGSALSTQMYYPDCIAADRFGNLYIADGNNNRVLKYNAGTVTIFAGTGVAGYTGVGGPAAGAELNDPKGVHIDGGGNVYIADFLNNCVRKVDATSGNITTIAGTTSPGATGDGGPATAATMSLPASVAMDSSHSLLIADFGNNVIRRVNSAGIIINVAGNYTAGYSGDGGQATAAQLSSPVGIQVDSAGSFYIADRNNNVVRKVTEVLLAEYDTTTVTDLCQDSCLRLTNTSIGSTDSILWTVSPAGPSFYSSPRLDTPTLCFTSSPAGTYAISLTIYYHGNSKTFSHNIIIKPTPVPTITQTGAMLSTGTTYSSYQWYNGTTAIPGATSSSLIWYPSPGVGSYKVLVDSNGCSGYSTVVNIVTTAVTKVNLPDNNKYWLAQGADNSVVNLYAAHAIDAPLTVTMFDATGREILSDMWDKGLSMIQIKAASLPPGMYLVKLTNSNTSQVLKWVKN